MRMRVRMFMRLLLGVLVGGRFWVPFDVEFSRRFGLELQTLGVLVLECQAQAVGMDVKLSSALTFDLQADRGILWHFKNDRFVRVGVARNRQLQAHALRLHGLA